MNRRNAVMEQILKVGKRCSLFGFFAILFFSCLYSSPVNSLKDQSAFEGSIALPGQQTLEFVWIGELNLWVGKYEVTLGQMVQILEKAKRNPERYAARYVEGDYDLYKFPAVKVSWDDAKDACNALNRDHSNTLPDGYIFRLPSGVEWEAMAKVGGKRIYPWGDSWPPSRMSDGVFPNLQGEEIIRIDGEVPRAIRPIEGYRDGWPSMAPVAQSGANEWGIYGLAGNVSEWCEDWYDEGKKLRLLKGASAFSNQSFQSEISWRRAVEGQSARRGLFFWGTVRNQGTMATGFRVIIEPGGK